MNVANELNKMFTKHIQALADEADEFIAKVCADIEERQEENGLETAYRAKDAAQLLAISPSKLRDLAQHGKIKGAKIGSVWTFRESALKEYQRSREDAVR